MEGRAKRFRRRAQAENGGKRGRGSRYSEALREEALQYYRARRSAGATKVSIASELGLSQMTLETWARKTIGRVKPVRLVSVQSASALDDSQLTVVTPSGHRVEGLSVSSAAALLRALA